MIRVEGLRKTFATRSGPVLSCTDLSLAPAAADSADDIGFRCCTAVTP